MPILYTTCALTGSWSDIDTYIYIYRLGVLRSLALRCSRRLVGDSDATMLNRSRKIFVYGLRDRHENRTGNFIRNNASGK